MTSTQPTPRRSTRAPKSGAVGRSAKSAKPRAASLSTVFEAPAPAKTTGLRAVAPEVKADFRGPVAAIVPLPREAPAGPPAAVPAVPAPATAPPAARPSRPPVTTAEMVAYWNRLRQGRRYPPFWEIDASYLVDGWPAAILFECANRGANPAAPARDVLRMSRLGNGTSNIAYTPMMMEWMLSLAREVVETGKAIEDRDEFPSSGSVARYRLVLLPLGEEQKGVGHVLGALERL